MSISQVINLILTMKNAAMPILLRVELPPQELIALCQMHHKNPERSLDERESLEIVHQPLMSRENKRIINVYNADTRDLIATAAGIIIMPTVGVILFDTHLRQLKDDLENHTFNPYSAIIITDLSAHLAVN
ncbi:MAG: hypothetical protein V1838_05620 [Patescibacteria group bacterium]